MKKCFAVFLLFLLAFNIIGCSSDKFVENKINSVTYINSSGNTTTVKSMYAHGVSKILMRYREDGDGFKSGDVIRDVLKESETYCYINFSKITNTVTSSWYPIIKPNGNDLDGCTHSAILEEMYYHGKKVWLEIYLTERVCGIDIDIMNSNGIMTLSYVYPQRSMLLGISLNHINSDWLKRIRTTKGLPLENLKSINYN